jgi:plasmid stabilization system protein ParE
MVEIRWTLQAANDLKSITAFIAEDSRHYARLLVIDVFKAVERLSVFPR